MAYEINNNVRAFLWVIRHCEGTAGPDGYRTLFGGKLFDSYADHPRKAVAFRLKGKRYVSTAAGAYQFLSRTWDGLVRQHKFPDFSPENQDQGAVRLIQGRRALKDVEDGNFETAITKCNREWASLPGSPYGQPVKTMEFCKKTYEQYGGSYQTSEKQMVAPAAVAVASAVATPFLEAAFKSLLGQLPTLAKLFGSGTAVSNRNIEAVVAAVEVVKGALGAKNEQEAVELLKTDPNLITTADAALQENFFSINQLNQEGIAKAREFSVSIANSGKNIWNLPAFWISVLLLPLVYYTVWAVFSGDITAGFTSEIKAQTAGAVISGVLGGVIGFWLGSSYTTSRSRGVGATPTQGE